MNTADPASPQPAAAHVHVHWHGPEAHVHWHQPDGHHDVQEHQPAPPSAESYRLAELEALERAVVEWRHCRVTGTDGVQLVCDHDRKLAAASRAAYRRVYPTE